MFLNYPFSFSDPSGSQPSNNCNLQWVAASKFEVSMEHVKSILEDVVDVEERSFGDTKVNWIYAQNYLHLLTIAYEQSTKLFNLSSKYSDNLTFNSYKGLFKIGDLN